MAQTPVSVNVAVTTNTPTTIYTVGAGKTAVVRNVNASTPAVSQSVTLNKTSGGTTYPITISRQISPSTLGTGSTPYYGANLLTAPITLAAGETLSFANDSSLLQFPIVASSSNGSTKIGGFPFSTTQSILISMITYANGIYMAIGYCTSGINAWPTNSGFIATSTDGLTWTGRPNFPAGQANLGMVVYGSGNTWVASGYDGTNYAACWYSTDNGVNWTKVSLTTTLSQTNACSIAYVNSTYIIGTTNGQLFKSTDGITWSVCAGYNSLMPYRGNTSTEYNAPLSIGYNNSQYVIGTANGTVFSTDLTTFTCPYSISGGDNIGSLAYGQIGITYNSTNSKWWWLANYNSNSTSAPILYSTTDGISWTPNTTLSGFIFGGGSSNPATIQSAGAYTAITSYGNNYITYTTDNGVNWTKGTRASTDQGPLVGLSNGAFVSFYNSAEFGSINDGARITTNPTIAGTAGGTIPYPANNFAVGASNGTAWVVWYVFGTSGYIGRISGTSTSNITNAGVAGFDAGTYGIPSGAAYLAATTKYYFITSAGYVFSHTGQAGAPTNISRITALNGTNYISLNVVGTTLVATSESGLAYTSTDGITWTKLTTPNAIIGGSAGYWSSSAASNGTIVVVPMSSGQTYTVSATTITTGNSLWGLRYQQNLNGNYFCYFYGSIPSVYNSLNYSLSKVTNINDISTYTFVVNNTTWFYYQYDQTPLYNGTRLGRYNVIAYAGGKYYFPTYYGITGSGYLTSTDLVNFTMNSISTINPLNGTTYLSTYTYPTIASNGTTFVIGDFYGTVNISGQALSNAPFYASTYVTIGAVEIS